MASEIEVNWRIGKSLHQRLQYILEGQCYTDVTFIVGAEANQKRMRANRFMLSCGSQVFEAMLQESSEDQVLVVDDVDPETFMEILKFVYYEQPTIIGDNALYILRAAKKFDLPKLAEKCSSFLKESMHLKYVCGVLNSSLVLDEHDLTDSCVTFSHLMRNSVLLNAEEKLEIYDMIADRDHGEIHLGTYRFNTTARRGPNTTKSQLTMARFVYARELKGVYNGRIDAIDFTSDKSLLVIGAGLYGGVKAGTHDVHMQLLDDKDRVLADTGNITMTSDGTTTPIPVLFSSPCQVDANRTYCIHATIISGNTYTGLRGKATVTSDKCTLSFSNSSCNSSTDVNQGQIPTIIVSLFW